MEVSVQRTDSQRSQNNNNGPRVSFNKDVHVKRIGPRPPIDSQNYQSNNNFHQSSNLRKELPQDLTREELLKEAEFVLKQAERINCHAEGDENFISGKVKDKRRGRIEKRKELLKNDSKFNSLPTRKKKPTKPIERSVSDASTKKSKRPTIFNLFSRKSDINIENNSNNYNLSNNNINNDKVKQNSNNLNEKRKRIGRSKSDVGVTKESQELHNRFIRKRNNSENEGEINSKKKTQLSPIIEVTQREDYFSDQPNSIDSQTQINQNHINKRNSEEKILNDLPTTTTPVSETIKETITTLSNSNVKPIEDMHSSQLPPLKPPLTKGITVDGMVKRLSMERFSPPPHFSTPAFSYTRSPTDQLNTPNNIIYAQVVCDDSGKNKQTIHSSYSPSQNNNNNNINNNSNSNNNNNNTINLNSSSHQSSNHNQKMVYENGYDVMDGEIRNGYNNPTSQKSYYKTQHLMQSNPSLSINTVTTKTTTNMRRSLSPSIHISKNYKKESFRPYNHQNSDEDEGLGYEIRRGLHDEDTIPTKDDEFKSLTEDIPITPKIRDVPPEKPPPVYDYNSTPNRTTDPLFPEFQDLSERRKILESRIHSRRIGGSREILEETTPERDFYKNPQYNKNTPELTGTSHFKSISRSPERIVLTKSKESSPHEHDLNYNNNYHNNNNNHSYHHEYHRERRSHSRELLNDDTNYHNDDLLKYHKYRTNGVKSSSYSPSRDIINGVNNNHKDNKDTVSTKVIRETKYYFDGHDGVKETYSSETKVGKDGQPHKIEHRKKERVSPKEIDLGYIEDHRDYEPIDPEITYLKYRQDNEPKSIDSQYSDFNRLTPENNNNNIKSFNKSTIVTSNHVNHVQHEKHPSHLKIDDYQNSLKRQKKHQRSFDKGDSGIENDYRKDSFNGELQSRWKKRTIGDDINVCEIFLKKERKHTEDTFLMSKRLINLHRERSIDDGSHFDPRLDKYTNDTLRKRSKGKSVERSESMVKNDKKISGLEKMKLLFTGTGKKKVVKKDEKKEKDRYMVKEEEMRARYTEYNGLSPAVHKPDISTRRRLSTPKSSPVPTRTSSQKSSKSSSNESSAQKLGWFKSIDRLSRKKSGSKVESALEDDFSSLKSKPKSNISKTSTPSKNLRFFGDTDIESDRSLSKTAYKPKNRQNVNSSNLTTNQKKHSRSNYELNHISRVDRNKSASMQHLEENGKPYNRSNRNLHDINELYNGSDNEIVENHTMRRSRDRSPVSTDKKMKSKNNNSPMKSNSSYEDSMNHHGDSEIPFDSKRYMYEENYRQAQDYRNSKSREHSREKSPYESDDRTLKRNDYKKPPPGPPKPARTLERRRGMSRDRERVQDSSGTEGESSQLSQRSVVYLHATTVGEIPTPYTLNSRRKAVSRDDLAAPRSKNLTPMTRTVSRSVSVLAPWKPRHLREGYEINYSQTNEKPKKFTSSKYENDNHKSSTLSRSKDKNHSNGSSTLSRTRKSSSRDELNDSRSSSKMNSSYKSNQSSSVPRGSSQGRESMEYRSDTLRKNYNKENNSSIARNKYN